MAPTLRTRSEVARWIVRQTLLAVGVGVPFTLLAVSLYLRFDFGRSLKGSEIAMFSVALAVLETAILTPPIALRSVNTLRRLNLAHDELARVAMTDPLTGLLNRRGVDAAVERRASSVKEPVAALMIDLDHFKAINDAHGHAFGDAALRRLAETLREAAEGSPNAIIGRQGGEEFVAILCQANGHDARRFADKVRTAFSSRPIEWNGAKAAITMSVGIAFASELGDGYNRLVARADAALYEAKAAGRDQIAFHLDLVRAA